MDTCQLVIALFVRRIPQFAADRAFFAGEAFGLLLFAGGRCVGSGISGAGEGEGELVVWEGV